MGYELCVRGERNDVMDGMAADQSRVEMSNEKGKGPGARKREREK